MKKFLLTAFVALALASVSTYAAHFNPTFDIAGVRLTDFEMQKISGEWFNFSFLTKNGGDNPKPFDHTQKPYDESKEHCDILAHNKAVELGLDTSDQKGNRCDYNKMTVKEIYAGYPKNRSIAPEEGTSGYYFTSSGKGKEHMGAYTRENGDTKTYTRHMNESFKGTDRSFTALIDYKPPKVVSQVFVSLPELPPDMRYYY